MASKEWDNTEDSVYLNFGRLTWHVSKKGFQLGSLIGIALVTPIALYRTRGKSPFSNALPQILRYQGISAISGFGVGVAMEAKNMLSYSKTGDVPGALQDRAYRLHYNKGQNRADCFSHLGSSIGILSTLLYRYRVKATRGVLGLVGGASVGAALGVLAHVATMEKKNDDDADDAAAAEGRERTSATTTTTTHNNKVPQSYKDSNAMQLPPTEEQSFQLIKESLLQAGVNKNLFRELYTKMKAIPDCDQAFLAGSAVQYALRSFPGCNGDIDLFIPVGHHVGPDDSSSSSSILEQIGSLCQQLGIPDDHPIVAFKNRTSTMAVGGPPF